MIEAFIHKTEIDAMFPPDEPITAGTVGRKVKCKFACDWDGLTKYVVFTGSNVSVQAVIEDDNYVVIPWECLTKVGSTLKIGAYGYTYEYRVLQSKPDDWDERTYTYYSRNGTEFTALGMGLSIEFSAGTYYSLCKTTANPTVWHTLGIIQDSAFEGGTAPKPNPTVDVTLQMWKEMEKQNGILNEAEERINSIADTIDDKINGKADSSYVAEIEERHNQDLSSIEDAITTINESIDRLEEASGTAIIETDETLSLVNGVLSVNTANEAEDDNTLPITSAAVSASIGNINRLLSII